MNQLYDNFLRNLVPDYQIKRFSAFKSHFLDAFQSHWVNLTLQPPYGIVFWVIDS